LCCGIVEQTRNGIWQYDEHTIEPKVPIFNVAASRLKLERESPLIGAAVVFNVRFLIEQLGKSLNRYKTLVVGYGSTGSHVAKALRDESVDTVVFDQIADRRQQAIADGFTSAESLAALLHDRHLIIGCTGQVPFQFKEILKIRHGAVFVNASSKRHQINYEELDKLTDSRTPQEKYGYGHRRRLLNGHDLVILANGYPVNFVGESVPDQEIAFVLVLLCECAIHLARGAGTLQPGILEVPDELQRRIEACHDSLSA